MQLNFVHHYIGIGILSGFPNICRRWSHEAQKYQCTLESTVRKGRWRSNYANNNIVVNSSNFVLCAKNRYKTHALCVVGFYNERGKKFAFDFTTYNNNHAPSIWIATTSIYVISYIVTPLLQHMTKLWCVISGHKLSYLNQYFVSILHGIFTINVKCICIVIVIE